jgi:hypothetical protein
MSLYYVEQRVQYKLKNETMKSKDTKKEQPAYTL